SWRRAHVRRCDAIEVLPSHGGRTVLLAARQRWAHLRSPYEDSHFSLMPIRLEQGTGSGTRSHYRGAGERRNRMAVAWQVRLPHDVPASRGIVNREAMLGRDYSGVHAVSMQQRSLETRVESRSEGNEARPVSYTVEPS